MSKNRVRQSYLILNLGVLCDFSLNTPEIFAPDARRWGWWWGGCGAAGRMRGGGAGGAQEGAYFAICELM